MRTIRIPTIYRQEDLEKQLGEAEARRIMEQIWLATHPAAARLLRYPLTQDQLDHARHIAQGRNLGKGSGRLIPVISKWFTVDESAAQRFLAFIEEEEQALKGEGGAPSLIPASGTGTSTGNGSGNGHKRTVSPKNLAMMRVNAAKARAARKRKLEASRGK